jgi:hypothetical protein
MKAVAIQRVAVSMRPTKDPFQAYKAGTIFSRPVLHLASSCDAGGWVRRHQRHEDEEVLDREEHIWPKLGHNGYVLIKQGVNTYGGLCEI